MKKTVSTNFEENKKIMKSLHPKINDYQAETVHTSDKKEMMSGVDITLRIAKVKRSYCIVSGYNVLRKFRTLESAVAEIKKNPEIYEFWAKSICSDYVNRCCSGKVHFTFIEY